MPIELQLASARTTAQYEAAMQQRRLYAANSHHNAALDHWPPQWAGPVQSFPAVPRGPPAVSSGRSSGRPVPRLAREDEDDHFPEIVRASGSRHAAEKQAQSDDSASDGLFVRSNAACKRAVEKPAGQAQDRCRSEVQPSGRLDGGATSLVSTPPRAEVGRSARAEVGRSVPSGVPSGLPIGVHSGVPSGVLNAPRERSGHGPQVAAPSTGPCRRAEAEASDEVMGFDPLDDE